MNLATIKLLVMDVDGTLTNGHVYFDAAGGEMKQFNIHDGLGIVLAGLAGITVAWITGRQSPMVERRARELKVAYLRQGVRDKAAALQALCHETGIPLSETAFLGDDLNDLPAMRLAAVAIAPANATPLVRETAHLVTPRAGGEGAARDAIETLLQARHAYETTVATYLRSLTENPITPIQ